MAAVPRRILGKFLDSFEEDVLPWHDVIEPLLSLIGNNLSDLEVRPGLDLAQTSASGPGPFSVLQNEQSLSLEPGNISEKQFCFLGTNVPLQVFSSFYKKRAFSPKAQKGRPYATTDPSSVWSRSCRSRWVSCCGWRPWRRTLRS